MYYREKFQSLIDDKRRYKELAKTLYSENKELVISLKNKNDEKKSLLKSVKKYMRHVQDNEEEEDCSMTSMVKLHEQNMNSKQKKHDGSGDDDDSVISTVSSLSTHSLVTDDGVPTLRYALNDKKGWGAVIPNEKIDSTDSDEQNTRKIYELSFPRGKKIGLQFQKVPLEIDVWNQIPYEGMLTSCNSSTTTACNSYQQHGSSSVEDAFLVCGFHGFDPNLNIQPPLGSRLIYVDNECLERGQWTFEEVKKMIYCKMTNGSTFKLVFRHDPLSDHQREMLMKATMIAADSSKSSPIRTVKKGCPAPSKGNGNEEQQEKLKNNFPFKVSRIKSFF